MDQDLDKDFAVNSSWLYGSCMNCGHTGPAHTTFTNGTSYCRIKGCTCTDVHLSPRESGDAYIFTLPESAKVEHTKNGKLVCTPGLDEIYYDDRFGSGNWFYCYNCKGVHHNKYHLFDSAVMEEDPVNHPSHYTMYKGLEIIDLTEQMNFNKGNAVKYIARAGFKGGPEKEIEDLKKAQWYISREIDRLESNPDDIP